METMIEIPVKKVSKSAIQDVNWSALQFGQHTADHMFECTYSNGEWQQPHIRPFQNLSLSPTTLAIHYGQSVFEGMKAFRMEDGRINIFRIEKHFERLNRSLERMCMPSIPYDLFVTALHQLVELDRQWVPGEEGSALYLRPFVFASEGKLGVKVSEEYKFLIVSGPVPTLYAKPISVKVERKYIRAARGGTGYAKCAGNYGGSFYPTQLAKEEGFDQVIWTDAFEHEFIEESGTMNLMFVINGKLVTPPISDSILDGVTRASLLELAGSIGIDSVERPVSVVELKTALKNGALTEVFGAGTAAVIAPVKSIGIDGEIHHLPAYSSTSVMYRLKNELESIRSGRKDDIYGWNSVVE
jgi:branched-chain amino acid aminotransferase